MWTAISGDMKNITNANGIEHARIETAIDRCPINVMLFWSFIVSSSTTLYHWK